MLNKQEIDEAIAELEHQRNHKPNELAYLSALYAVRDHAFHTPDTTTYDVGYSRAAEPVNSSETLGRYGDSDFMLAIVGKAPADVWKIVDKHMDNLQIVNPRMYESVIRKMRQL